MPEHPFLFNVPDTIRVPAKACTAAPIGTGPAGETCGTCKHKTRVHGGQRMVLKCELMKKAWSHGAGTDIRAKWPACRCWEAKDKVPA